MWGVFDETFSQVLDRDLVAGVKLSYGLLTNDLIDGTNPIEKISLVVSNDKGNMALSFLIDDEDDETEVVGNICRIRNDGGGDNRRRRLNHASEQGELMSLVS